MKNNVKTSVTTYIHVTSYIHVKHIKASTDDMLVLFYAIVIFWIYLYALLLYWTNKEKF